MKFCDVLQNSISNRCWKLQISFLKNKIVLFQKKFLVVSKYAKIDPKDGACCPNFQWRFWLHHALWGLLKILQRRHMMQFEIFATQNVPEYKMWGKLWSWKFKSKIRTLMFLLNEQGWLFFKNRLVQEGWNIYSK